MRLLGGPPRSNQMKKFIEQEKDRVVMISWETEWDDVKNRPFTRVFIYTNSSEWDDGNGSGTFAGDSEREAIRLFRKMIQKNTTGRI